MSTSLTLQHDGFTIEHGSDGIARIRDVDLAERLGLARDRKIRDLIKRYLGELGDVHVRPTVGRTSMPRGGERSVAVDEYWLTEEQALFIVVKSDAPRAIVATKHLIAAFIAMRESLAEQHRAAQPIFQRLLEAIIAPQKSDWERMFPESLVRAICKLHSVEYVSGTHPRFLASTNAKIYDMVFSSPVGREIRARNPNPSRGKNHHQTLTPEARTYFASQIPIIEAIANGSASKADFWARMERNYAGGMLQLGLGGAS